MLLRSTPIDELRLPEIRLEDLLVGAAIVLGGYLLSRLLRLVLQKLFLARGRSPSYAGIFSTLGGWALLAAAVAVGLTVAFPSVQFSSILGGLGIVSVAVGIAAQSVLGNLFAGILTVYREPFRPGDQVAIGEVRGTVVDVNLRETVVRTFDGKRVLIPNGVATGGVVTVQTGYERIRTTVLIGISCGTDLERARAVALEAVRAVPSVHDDPPPRVLFKEVTASTAEIAVVFWSGSTQLETVEALDAVIPAIVTAYREAGIEMPKVIHHIEPGPSAVRLAERLAGEDGGPGRSGREGNARSTG